MLDDAGWNCHQFHATTEFFADFGVYDVSLTVPTGWLLGATGREQSKTDRGNGTTTHRYVETDVHDFAWTTSPVFVERHDRFETPGLPAVDIRLLLQPEHTEQAERHFDATPRRAQALRAVVRPVPVRPHHDRRSGHIFIGRAGRERRAAMEYPTLFTAGTRWYAPWLGIEPETVTVHEAGHQWWHGIVATNEFEHAWMDEGLNTFATARAMAAAWPHRFVTVERYFGGIDPVVVCRRPVVARCRRRSSQLRFGRRRAPMSQSTPSWQYWPASARQISYLEDGAVAGDTRKADRVADDFSASSRPTSSAARFGIRRPRSSSPSRTRSAART